MTKREFLKEIRFYLEKAYLRLNPVEIEDIMRDYDEYFREGTAEGQTEEELVQSLGNPKELVDEMVENDIEDQKYSREDFKDYFEEEKKESNINIGETIKKGGKGVGFLGKKAAKIILVMAVAFADLFYFPMVIFGSLAAVAATAAILVILPTVGGVFSVIGQSMLSLIFPAIFAVACIVLEIMLAYLLLKLGYKANKAIFSKAFGNRQQNM